MNKTAYIILMLGLVVVIGLIFTGGSKPVRNNVEVIDGVQYVTIDAKGGYWPRVTEAQSGLPTKLVMKTNGTYDCSVSLAIHSIGFQKILPQTGETEIDLGIPKRNEPLQGVCGMGMYSFQINFI